MINTAILIFLCTIFVVASTLLDIRSKGVGEKAEWAVNELKQLSDSGIYESLQLESILEAEEEDGIYHLNTILKLKLSSPYFANGQTIQVFEMIVMNHYEEEYSTIAIDQFPEMDEDAIEEYYIRKVERKRVERDAAIKVMLDAQYQRESETSMSGESSIESLNNATLKELKEALTKATLLL